METASRAPSPRAAQPSARQAPAKARRAKAEGRARAGGRRGPAKTEVTPGFTKEEMPQAGRQGRSAGAGGVFERVGGLVERAPRSRDKILRLHMTYHESPYRRVAVCRAAALVGPRARRHRRALRDHRADAREGERRDLHQDRPRNAAGPGAAPDAASRSTSPRTRATPSCARRSTRSRRGLLVSAVDEMLIVQRGKELGYKLSDEQFKSVLDNLKTENKIETDEQFQAALKQENMTMADLRRNLERQMISRACSRTRCSGASASPTTRRTSTTTRTWPSSRRPRPIMLREILVTVPADPRGVNAAADEAAQGEGRADSRARRRPASRSRSWPPRCRTRRRRPTAA